MPDQLLANRPIERPAEPQSVPSRLHHRRANPEVQPTSTVERVTFNPARTSAPRTHVSPKTRMLPQVEDRDQTTDDHGNWISIGMGIPWDKS